MKVTTLKAWYQVHKWTSLVCTLFLLIICLTGLPLIFTEEIEHALDDGLPYATLPEGTPRVNLDEIVRSGARAFPGQVVRSIFLHDHEPALYLSMAPTQEADPKFTHWIKYDARTGQELNRAPEEPQHTFMDVMFRLHVDWFAGLPGELFMCAMATLFTAAIVSGVVVYPPFMKRIAFGTVRTQRSPRIKWLDLHNLLGAATLIWLTVIGLTGVINELATPLFSLWQTTDVRAQLHEYAGKPLTRNLSSVERAFQTAQAAAPGKTIVSVIYPTNEFGSPNHYVMWTKGSTPLTSQLLTPVLVDAESGVLTAVMRLPWYLTALEVSRPLHFGDYAGLPLKILWALLDVIAIVVLVSGLYLWWTRRRSMEARIEELSQAAAPGHA